MYFNRVQPIMMLFTHTLKNRGDQLDHLLAQLEIISEEYHSSSEIDRPLYMSDIKTICSMYYSIMLAYTHDILNADARWGMDAVRLKFDQIMKRYDPVVSLDSKAARYRQLASQAFTILQCLKS